MALIAAEVKTWVEAAGGALFAVQDPQAPYFILAGGGHRGFCAVLGFSGDDPADSASIDDMTEFSIDIFVGHARDMRLEPGAFMFKDEPITGAKSLLRRVSELRAAIMTIVFAPGSEVQADDDSYCMYRGCKPAVLPGTDIPLPAYKVTFAWHARLDDDANWRYLNAPASSPAPLPSSSSVRARHAVPNQ